MELIGSHAAGCTAKDMTELLKCPVEFPVSNKLACQPGMAFELRDDALLFGFHCQTICMHTFNLHHRKGPRGALFGGLRRKLDEDVSQLTGEEIRRNFAG